MARWILSPAAQAASDAIPSDFRYDQGGPWNAANCASSWTPRAQAIATMIRRAFSWVRTIGGLRCEQLFNTGQLSIHAVGRALDVMVPTGGTLDGDALANWLVTNAQTLGVQLVIWNSSVWQGSRRPAYRLAVYTGPNHHTDHVHVEVQADAPGATVAPSAASAPTTTANGGGSNTLPLLILAAVAVWFATQRKR